LRKRAYNTLKANILTSHFRRGDRLSETRLSASSTLADYRRRIGEGRLLSL
jgi:hypothetical protein